MTSASCSDFQIGNDLHLRNLSDRTIMADNYIEKKFEELQAKKAKEQRARQLAWKKRMDAYRKKLEEQSNPPHP